MSKFLSFVKLDFITVKPYLSYKNMLIFLVVVVALSSGDTGGAVIIGIIMAFSLMYSSYPFAVGEKNAIDQLYFTLPLDKHSVVLGRYGFVLSLDVLSGILAIIFIFISQTVLQKPFSVPATLLTTLALFVIYTFFQAIQLPIYFKLGYTKAKFLAYMPIAIFPVVSIAVGSRFSGVNWMASVYNVLIWISNNQIIAIVIATITWATIMLISYCVSLSFYKKREF